MEDELDEMIRVLDPEGVMGETYGEELQRSNENILPLAVFDNDFVDHPLFNGELENFNNQNLNFNQITLPPIDYVPCCSTQDSINSSNFCLPGTLKSTPGPYNFHLDKQQLSEKVTKSAPFTYSELLDKYFFNINKSCPLIFRTDPLVPSGSRIRLTVLNKKIEFRRQPVKCCEDHVHTDLDKKYHFMVIQDEFNQPFTKTVSYETNLEGHCSVSIDLGKNGQEKDFCVVYEFRCLNSCLPKATRKEIILYFELLNNKEILGTNVLDAQVSTSPGRDRKRQQEAIEGNVDEISAAPQQLAPLPIKVLSQSQDGKVVEVKVKTRKRKELLEAFVNRVEGLRLFK